MKFHNVSIVFSNLESAIINGVRMWVKSILLMLSDSEIHGTRTHRLSMMGCGSTCAWKVFDIDVDTLDYQLVNDARTRQTMLVIGAIELQLHVADYDRPIDVKRFEARTADLDGHAAFHREVAQCVLDKAIEYHRAPNIGGAVYGPTALMRDFLAKFN